jgi:hypothetical protein
MRIRADVDDRLDDANESLNRHTPPGQHNDA